tara:strand:+ start:28 stop:243 length:216 start_codon:yes stop_codon:yes gene_type:complete
MKNYKFRLSPTQEKNLQNVVLQNGKPLFPKAKRTKTTEEILIEGVIFGISATLILTFISAIIILITNLLNY